MSLVCSSCRYRHDRYCILNSGYTRAPELSDIIIRRGAPRLPLLNPAPQRHATRTCPHTRTETQTHTHADTHTHINRRIKIQTQFLRRGRAHADFFWWAVLSAGIVFLLGSINSDRLAPPHISSAPLTLPKATVRTFCGAVWQGRGGLIFAAVM